MRFQYVGWGLRAPAGAAACDGLVPGAAIDLSHWSHNKTPRHLKRDTSVEIALAFARERSSHDVELAANNHFDADGVLAVWTLLNPSLALAHEAVIVAAAEHGDFDEWPKDERGIMLEAAIARLASDLGDSEAYARVLPMLDTLVPAIESREDLWGDAYRALLAEERAEVEVERVGRIAVFTHAPRTPELSGAWLARRAPVGTDRWLIATSEGSGGYKYRYELPRYAWADTVVRPRLQMPKRGIIRRTLGEAWIVKGRRGMTGIAYTLAAVPDQPREVALSLDLMANRDQPRAAIRGSRSLPPSERG
jgi:hypothetical protein